MIIPAAAPSVENSTFSGATCTKSHIFLSRLACFCVFRDSPHAAETVVTYHPWHMCQGLPTRFEYAGITVYIKSCSVLPNINLQFFDVSFIFLLLGVADDSDSCPFVSNAGDSDSDSDGVGDACDNCVDTGNANQADADQNGYGDACDVVGATNKDRYGLNGYQKFSMKV